MPRARGESTSRRASLFEKIALHRARANPRAEDVRRTLRRKRDGAKSLSWSCARSARASAWRRRRGEGDTRMASLARHPAVADDDQPTAVAQAPPRRRAASRDAEAVARAAAGESCEPTLSAAFTRPFRLLGDGGASLSRLRLSSRRRSLLGALAESCAADELTSCRRRERRAVCRRRSRWPTHARALYVAAAPLYRRTRRRRATHSGFEVALA